MLVPCSALDEFMTLGSLYSMLAVVFLRPARPAGPQNRSHPG